MASTASPICRQCSKNHRQNLRRYIIQIRLSNWHSRNNKRNYKRARTGTRQKLDAEGLAISLQKCEFAKNTIEWLGFTITTTEITPLVTQTEAIVKLVNPKTHKQLRSFLGSVHPNQIHPEPGPTIRTTPTITQ